MVTVFGSRLCALSVAGGGDFLGGVAFTVEMALSPKEGLPVTKSQSRLGTRLSSKAHAYCAYKV